MDIMEIQKYLPHRYPFLLVDRVVEFEENKKIVFRRKLPRKAKNDGLFGVDHYS